MVTVRYERVGKEARAWEQELLADTEEMIVSSFVFRLKKPFIAKEDILIEDGYHGVLFDLFDRWFNVVKVFDKEKRFTGYYSDIRTPPKRTKEGIRATDLILDIWVDVRGDYIVLDQDEFREAELNDDMRRKVMGVRDSLIEMIEAGDYPPKEVRSFDVSAHEI